MKTHVRPRWIISCAATLVAALLTAPMLLGAAEPAPAGQYQLDPKHSSFYFRIDHLNMALVYGRFNEAQGQLTLGDEPSFEFTIQTESVDTGVEQRDEHLRNPDFFNAKQYPTITFESTEVTATDDGYEVTGEMSLHGQSNTITVPLRHTGAGEDPWGNQRVGFATEFTLNRSDYGMDNMLDQVGDEVELLISFEAVRQDQE